MPKLSLHSNLQSMNTNLRNVDNVDHSEIFHLGRDFVERLKLISVHLY